MERKPKEGRNKTNRISRHELLKRMACGGLAVTGAGTLLSACAPDLIQTEEQTATPAAGRAPSYYLSTERWSIGSIPEISLGANSPIYSADPDRRFLLDIAGVSVLVTVRYDEVAVKAAGLDELALTLRPWNAAAGSWEDAACAAYVRNEAADWLQAPVCHLSDFGLFEQRLDVFLPVVIRSR